MVLGARGVYIVECVVLGGITLVELLREFGFLFVSQTSTHGHLKSGGRVIFYK